MECYPISPGVNRALSTDACRPGAEAHSQAVRIIGGLAAGRLLKVPEGLGVRPTPDKVKLAVFNSLGAFLDGARVLDLFAGSGALGLECLSRGAREMVSIEKSEKHARFFRQNLAASGLPVT